MNLPKKNLHVVLDAITELEKEQVLDSATATRVRANLLPERFDWRRLARYAFVTALTCAIIGVGALLADKLILEFLARLFTAPAIVKSLGLAIAAAGIFALGLRYRRRHPGNIYTTEMIFVAGVIGVAGAIAWLGKAIDTGSGHYPPLLLLGAVIYCALGLGLASKLIWIFGLLSLGSWFGAETGYASGWGAYYLGMAYPLRFVLFGLALTLATLLMKARPRLAPFHRPSLVMGLLYLFIALWILSIWGNFDGYDDWRRATHWELFHWSVYFAAAAIACIYLGLRHDDGLLRGFGLTFFFLNLYTRFFEYFWDHVHKGVLFLALAASFWLIGSRAEALWQMNRLKEKIAP